MSTYLSICAIYRDEAPSLLEWIEFHRLVGVERFFLYDNESTDAHRELLAPYIESGTVTLTEWHVFPGQMAAYEHCLAHHRDDSRWIAFIDLDEFLFSPTGRTLPEVLADYESWPGVGVTRMVFGTSGHSAKPPGLVIENYTQRAWTPHTIKSIVDPRAVTTVDSPHSFSFRSSFAVDEAKSRIEEPPFTAGRSCSLLRINHYVTKSEREFEAKLSRPRADSGTLRTVSRAPEQWNAVKDETITSYVPALRGALGMEQSSAGADSPFAH
jgi:hypothetical protein